MALNCVILNGGWPALAGTTGLPASAAPRPAVSMRSPGAGPVGVIDRETLKRQLDGGAQVFDSRTRAEFTGEDARNRSRSGHLPGARHLSHADLMENGIVRPAPVLRGMLEQVGFGPGDHIVTHCEGGGRARWPRPRRCAPGSTMSGCTISASATGCATKAARSCGISGFQ